MRDISHPLDSCNQDRKPLGPFGREVHNYAAHGLRVFPTGGRDGKKPSIRGWPKVGLRAVPELVRKFPDHNIGVIDGHRDGITRIDIDDPELTASAIARFGDTPIKGRYTKRRPAPLVPGQR